MRVAPYPFQDLETLSRSTAATLQRWARSAALESVVRGGAKARTWLGVPLVVRPGRPQIETEGSAIVPANAAHPTLALIDEGRAALLLEGALASVLVERTLGGDRDARPVGPMNDVELGVLAYAVGRWLADGSSPFRVAAAFAHPLAGLAYVGARRVAWPLSISLGAVSAGAVLWTAVDRLPVRRARVFDGNIPLTLSVRAGEATLETGELSALRRGDVVVPTALDLDRVALIAANGTPLFEGRIRDGAFEITRKTADFGASTQAPEGARHDRGKESPMNESDLERLSDVPVTLTIELARLTLPLREIASLSVGEIVRTHEPIAHRAVLRAGDRVVARGELVDVDGELGVRLLEVITEPE